MSDFFDRNKKKEGLGALFAERRVLAVLLVSAVVILAFVSLAVQIVLRGLWAGPWLMNIKGLSRIEAGNVLMLVADRADGKVGPRGAGLHQALRPVHKRFQLAT